MTFSLDACRVLSLAGVNDSRGSLHFVEGGKHIPFEIQRVFYIHGIAPGCARGGHAHWRDQEVVIPVSGHFDMVLSDGKKETTYHLSRADQGLYICPLIWVRLENFSPDAVCLVLAAQRYDESDYLRDHDAFLSARAAL
jgi:dTDP-4-dehydrorhamnose 3,5-epimerase-like enzyme